MDFLSFFIENISERYNNIQNSQQCFPDMKIISRRNGCDSVNNESAGYIAENLEIQNAYRYDISGVEG